MLHLMMAAEFHKPGNHRSFRVISSNQLGHRLINMIAISNNLGAVGPRDQTAL